MTPTHPKLEIPPGTRVQQEVPYGVNEVRLNARQWVIALPIVCLFATFVPWLWERVERFDTGPDFRLPYELSKDYWLYSRRLNQLPKSGKIILLGDSVVWGEYVLPNGTLSHFFNRAAGEKERFINGGLNGLFPLAEEGLVNNYSRALQGQKVILYCNLLWMSSPKADLSTDKEEQFNHSRLVPQFYPKIPCYRADANERLSAVIDRNVPFFSWVGHLQNAYFGQKSIPSWTLEESGNGAYTNAWKNPLSQITLTVPSGPAEDPQRGPKSPRHKPWSTSGQGSTRFDWVSLDRSLQWHAFQRVVQRLRAEGNDVLVILGPFNEHMMEEQNRVVYQSLRAGISDWLQSNHVPTVAPELLPSALYADASHPLTEGYEVLAQRVYDDRLFRKWIKVSDE